MMGDTVLFEDEVNPVMIATLDKGLEVTSLHNHFFLDQPKIYFIHIGGKGTASRLDTSVRKIYDRITEIRAEKPSPMTVFPGTIIQESMITPAPLEEIFGMKGESNNGMFKVTIGREATMHGVKVGMEMGMNTWTAFAGSDTQAQEPGSCLSNMANSKNNKSEGSTSQKIWYEGSAICDNEEPST